MATRVHKALTAVPVSLALALSMALPGNWRCARSARRRAFRRPGSTVQASAELDSLNKEYDALQAQLSGLDSQINETTQKVQDAQQKMLEGRETLSGSILSQYKGDGSLSLVNIVLSSEDISEFTKNLTYYSSIQEDQAQKVAEQEQLRDTFSSALGELDTQRDEQQKLIDEAEQKKSQAEKVVSDASAKVSSIKESRLRPSWQPCKLRQRKCRRRKRPSSKLPRMHRSQFQLEHQHRPQPVGQYQFQFFQQQFFEFQFWQRKRWLEDGRCFCLWWQQRRKHP